MYKNTKIRHLATFIIKKFPILYSLETPQFCSKLLKTRFRCFLDFKELETFFMMNVAK